MSDLPDDKIIQMTVIEGGSDPATSRKYYRLFALTQSGKLIFSLANINEEFGGDEPEIKRRDWKTLRVSPFIRYERN